ncbi:MAG TPA: response regulator [Candidatus Acidoferrales bacterium]|nr:response regulator [Candidatus Acidoferrales bacterium]
MSTNTNDSPSVNPLPEGAASIPGNEPSRATDSSARPERRQRRRALISAPIRVRCEGLTGDGPDEISTTVDVSRAGVLFLTTHSGYFRGMSVRVTFPYTKAPGALQAEQEGSVVRVSEISNGRRAIAIALGATGVGEDLVDAAGRKLNEPQTNDLPAPVFQRSSPNKPLVLVVDSEAPLRETVKNLLSAQGYEVIAVSNAVDGREVLNLFSPALVIAEIEGEGFPGYDICAHVKGTPRLRCVPVILTTRSAYPSDYANAHSLGALVCMAKPFRKERLAHVAQLLAPVPAQDSKSAPRVEPGRPVARGLAETWDLEP